MSVSPMRKSIEPFRTDKNEKSEDKPRVNTSLLLDNFFIQKKRDDRPQTSG
jgi:hypothetical protein